MSEQDLQDPSLPSPASLPAPLPAPPAAAVLSGPMRLLVEAVAALRAQDAVELPGSQALAEAGVLLRELEKLTAVSLTRLADVHTRELHALDGAPSAGAWVERQQVGLGRDRVALAGRLARLPQVTGQLADGLLPLGSAVLIGQALDKLRRHLDRPDGLIDDQPAEQVLTAVIIDGVLMLVAQARGGFAEHDPELTALTEHLQQIAATTSTGIARLEGAFLLLAAHLEPGHLRPALAQLVDAVLPVQLEDRAERAHQQRGLKLVRHADGSGWTITAGELDLECGELLHTVLSAARGTDPANPTDTTGWAAQHTGEPGGPAPRSRRQQDHDALTLALRRLLDTAALGQRDKTCPHLLITVSLEQLEQRPGALPATTATGTALPASLVRRWWCDSRLTRLVLSLGHRVIQTSHTERTLRAHERRALHVQWGGRCAGAGCTSPPGTPLVPHHASPWHTTGTTAFSDSIPLCATTHHDLHTGNKTVRLRDGRHLGPHGWADPPGS